MNKSLIGFSVLSLAFAGAVFADDPAPAQTGAVTTVSKVDFTVVDKDRDGRISQSEAHSYGGTLDASFSKLDGDKDRYLSKMEFGKWEPAESKGGSTTPPVESSRPAPAPVPSGNQDESTR